MNLNDLRDNPGATHPKKRLGRGIGSGTGKTGGRGHKGQKARSGVAVKGFEGGQMPIHRRLPKRGFNNLFSRDLNEVNLERIQEAVTAGKLDTGITVTVETLCAAGVLAKRRDGVKILGRGELGVGLAFEVAGASKSALEAIERVGGRVTILAKKPGRAVGEAAAPSA